MATKLAAKPRKYRKVKCFTSVTAAKSEARKMRAAGKTARVQGKCVLSAGMRKKTASTGRRKRRA